MSNISEVLARNGLDDATARLVESVTVGHRRPGQGQAVRRVLETVARLLDDADAIERSLGGVTPGSAEKTDAIESVQAVVLQKRADARAILAEVLR